MSEIEFRGISIKSGEWVYGCLVRKWIQTRKDNGRLVTEILFQIKDNNGEIWNDSHEVIPETVGQFIRKKDINGIKIYEKDICINNRKEIGIIIYGGNSYVLAYIPPYDWDPMGQYDGRLNNLFIIGNTINNPEFIKGR